jgi:hypothetical protein
MGMHANQPNVLRRINGMKKKHTTIALLPNLPLIPTAAACLVRNSLKMDASAASNNSNITKGMAK